MQVIQLRPTTQAKGEVPPQAKGKSASFKRHAARLAGKAPLQEGEIKALCWALNGARAVNLTAGDREELLTLLRRKAERPITPEQTARGIEWLRRQASRANGEPRRTKDFPFTDGERPPACT